MLLACASSVAVRKVHLQKTTCMSAVKEHLIEAIDEIELELKSGSLKTLLTYVLALTENFSLSAGLQSKYEQGLILLGQTVCTVKQQDQPVGPALQKLLAAL